MKNESLFTVLLGMLAKSFIEFWGGTIDDEVNKTGSSSSRTLFALVKIMLVLSAILLFVGEEVVKVIFRKNFGKKSLNWFKLTLAFICFISIGLYSFYIIYNNQKLIDTFGMLSFVITGIFYIILGCFTLIKGIIEINRAKKMSINPSYEGDSIILGFLANDGWSQKKIQKVAEPLLCFALGLFLATINPILGIPIIFCGFSVWVYQLIESAWGLNPVKTTLEQKGYNTTNTNNGFSEVTF